MTNMNTRKHSYDWEMIDSWRDEGLSYNKIRTKHQEEFGYAPAKGTLSTRYGPGVRQKQIERYENKINDPKYIFSKKISRFKDKRKSDLVLINTISYTNFRGKIKNFKRRHTKVKKVINDYNVNDVKEHFWPGGKSKCGHEFPFISCYLSGETVDVTSTLCHTDHIDPNGGNELDNMGFTAHWANQMKHNFTLDELLERCKKILEHRG